MSCNSRLMYFNSGLPFPFVSFVGTKDFLYDMCVNSSLYVSCKIVNFLGRLKVFLCLPLTLTPRGFNARRLRRLETRFLTKCRITFLRRKFSDKPEVYASFRNHLFVKDRDFPICVTARKMLGTARDRLRKTRLRKQQMFRLYRYDGRIETFFWRFFGAILRRGEGSSRWAVRDCLLCGRYQNSDLFFTPGIAICSRFPSPKAEKVLWISFQCRDSRPPGWKIILSTENINNLGAVTPIDNANLRKYFICSLF